jgi:hypothetical protein
MDALRAALDTGPTPVCFLFRDDDAGGDDTALEGRLDVFEPHGLPRDVDTIPLAASYRTVELITTRQTSGRNDRRVHQRGFAVLSRYLFAGTAGVPGLVELRVTVDWFGKWKKVPLDQDVRGGELPAAMAGGQAPVGVMLHHAVMSAHVRTDLGELLSSPVVGARTCEGRQRVAPEPD